MFHTLRHGSQPGNSHRSNTDDTNVDEFSSGDHPPSFPEVSGRSSSPKNFEFPPNPLDGPPHITVTDIDPKDKAHPQSSASVFGRKCSTTLTVCLASVKPEDVVVAGQRPSVWSIYNKRAKKHDEKLLGSWESSMDVLLVFVSIVHFLCCGLCSFIGAGCSFYRNCHYICRRFPP